MLSVVAASVKGGLVVALIVTNFPGFHVPPEVIKPSIPSGTTTCTVLRASPPAANGGGCAVAPVG